MGRERLLSGGWSRLKIEKQVDLSFPIFQLLDLFLIKIKMRKH